jgi:predicted TPR repeat methyltransferase
VLRQAGRLVELEQAFDEWLQRDPENPVAAHMRAAARGDRPPARASDQYVRAVFDQFAAHFDADLADLHYHTPEQIGAAVAQMPAAGEQRLRILDAGCGTGLCGVHLRSFAAVLDGVDLSAKMVDQARQRNLYDHLAVAELTDFLARRPAAYDVITAGDTFNYFGDLEPLLASAAGALQTHGRLIFTLEVDDGVAAGHGFRLQPNGRYAHALSYATRCLQAAGFHVDTCQSVVLRRQAEQQVQGILLQATRQPKTV